MRFHENRLPTDESHEISCLKLLFLKKQQHLKLSSVQIIGGALWVKVKLPFEKMQTMIAYIILYFNYKYRGFILGLQCYAKAFFWTTDFEVSFLILGENKA